MDEAVFTLRRTESLPAGGVACDVAAVLDDPVITGYAPGVLSVVCECMDAAGSHRFIAYVHPRRQYELDIQSSLLTFLEHAPALVSWASAPVTVPYTLDFDGQGVNLRFQFTHTGGGVALVVIEDHWQPTRPPGEPHLIDAAALIHSCRAVAGEVWAVARQLDDRFSTLPSVVQWAQDCGL